jgi:hypothetical protein
MTEVGRLDDSRMDLARSKTLYRCDCAKSVRLSIDYDTSQLEL